MSKYLVFDNVIFKSRDDLVDALKAVGYTTVEVGKDLVLYGYEGRARPERAEVVVRRKYVGGASNDLGFTRKEEGLVPVISDYDTSRHGEAWLAKLQTEYNDRMAVRLAERLKGSVTREQRGQHRVVTVNF